MKVEKMKSALLLVAGLPASGKTWFARALSEKLGACHINSDATRTDLGLRGEYDTASKQRVYDAMLRQAKAALEDGAFVIVDSTFFKQSLRQPWEDLAEKCGVPCHFIEMKIPESASFRRLQKKREDSEATTEVYLKLKAEWENIEKPHLTLDSNELSLDEMVRLAVKYLTENS